MVETAQDAGRGKGGGLTGPMAARYRKIAWRGLPLAGLALALAASWLKAPTAAVILPVIELAVLMGVVFACVHHADVIAHRTGEPYGAAASCAGRGGASPVNNG